MTVYSAELRHAVHPRPSLMTQDWTYGDIYSVTEAALESLGRRKITRVFRRITPKTACTQAFPAPRSA